MRYAMCLLLLGCSSAASDVPGNADGGAREPVPDDCELRYGPTGNRIVTCPDAASHVADTLREIDAGEYPIVQWTCGCEDEDGYFWESYTYPGHDESQRHSDYWDVLCSRANPRAAVERRCWLPGCECYCEEWNGGVECQEP